MNIDDIERLHALANRLGCSPADVFLAVAMMVDLPHASAFEIVSMLRENGRRNVAPKAVERLLMTPASSYAPGHVDDALASLWGATTTRAR